MIFDFATSLQNRALELYTFVPYIIVATTVGALNDESTSVKSKYKNRIPSPLSTLFYLNNEQSDVWNSVIFLFRSGERGCSYDHVPYLAGARFAMLIPAAAPP